MTDLARLSDESLGDRMQVLALDTERDQLVMEAARRLRTHAAELAAKDAKIAELEAKLERSAVVATQEDHVLLSELEARFSGESCPLCARLRRAVPATPAPSEPEPNSSAPLTGSGERRYGFTLSQAGCVVTRYDGEPMNSRDLYNVGSLDEQLAAVARERDAYERWWKAAVLERDCAAIERDELESERDELRSLARRAVVYAREDRMLTPGFTRLRRVLDEIEATFNGKVKP